MLTLCKNHYISLRKYCDKTGCNYPDTHPNTIHYRIYYNHPCNSDNTPPHNLLCSHENKMKNTHPGYIHLVSFRQPLMYLQK